MLNKVFDVVIRMIEKIYPAPELVQEDNHNPPVDLTQKARLESIQRAD